MRRLTDNDRLDIVASQAHGQRDTTGVSVDEGDAAAWTVAGASAGADPGVDDDGAGGDSGAGVDGGGSPGGGDGGAATKVGGARAIALALAVGRNSRWPLWPWKLPGAPWLLDRIYGVVAANRYRIPGERAWCVEHPDACHPNSS